MFVRRSSVGFAPIFGSVVKVRDLRALILSCPLCEIITLFRTAATTLLYRLVKKRPSPFIFLQYFAAFDLSADAGVIHAVQAILSQVYVISDGAAPVCVFHRKIASVEADFVIEPMPRRYAHDVFLTSGRCWQLVFHTFTIRASQCEPPPRVWTCVRGERDHQLGIGSQQAGLVSKPHPGCRKKRLLIQLGFTLIFFADFSTRPEWPPPTFPLVVAIPWPLIRDKLAPKSSSVRNLEPGGMPMPRLRRCCNSSKIITARHTKERGEYECENGVACNWGVLWYPWPWFSVLRRNCSFQAKSTLSSRNTLKSMWPLWTRTRT
jgi:hypothetical protein